MDPFRRLIHSVFKIGNTLHVLTSGLSLSEKLYDSIKYLDAFYLQRLCICAFPLKPRENFTHEVSSPFWLIVTLNLSSSILLRAMRVLVPVCVWGSVSSLHLFLWHFTSFFSHMPILKIIPNKTCAAHMCLCFGW